MNKSTKPITTATSRTIKRTCISSLRIKSSPFPDQLVRK
jgi:hypothetical protein